MRKRLLTYVLFILTITSGSLVTAQVAGEKSRLRIGETPKPTTATTTTLSAYIVAPNISQGISFNKSKAVNDFYRELLLRNNPSKSEVVSAKVVATNETTEDVLFRNSKLHVSNIYPNPANAFAKVDFEIKDGSTKAELIFYDTLGRKITSTELDSFDRSVRIDTRNWDTGTYLYQLVLDGKKTATKKLIVMHN